MPDLPEPEYYHPYLPTNSNLSNDTATNGLLNSLSQLDMWKLSNQMCNNMTFEDIQGMCNYSVALEKAEYIVQDNLLVHL